MNNFKPIETVYRGYKFRSRLEAKWAVFFDKMGYCWEYEPEGFEGKCWNGDYFKYLPDFKLYPAGKHHSYYFWVEVKGDPLFLKNNWQKLENMLDFNPVLPDIQYCFDHNQPSHGLILLPDLPKFTNWSHDILFTCLGHHEGVLVKHFKFDEDCLDFEPLGELLSNMDDGDFSFQPKYRRFVRDDLMVFYSFDQAKQSRFEHGEKP